MTSKRGEALIGPVLFAAMVAISDPAVAQQSATLSADSYMRVGIGMTLPRVRRITGASSKDQPPVVITPGCLMIDPPHWPAGVRVMFLDQVVARFDVYKPGVKTAAGVEVGDTEATVYQKYRGPENVKTSMAFYDKDGHYLTVASGKPGIAILFETNGKVVVSYRLGTAEAVQYVEGCD